jgi:hypothetical protein
MHPQPEKQQNRAEHRRADPSSLSRLDQPDIPDHRQRNESQPGKDKQVV